MAVFIALGANQDAVFEGETLAPAQTFMEVLQILNRSEGMTVTGASGVWQSPAWPDPEAQAPYKNAVISIESRYGSRTLLNILKTIEYSFGRRANIRNAARPLDLDVLDYNGEISKSAKLALPHPRMLDRAFVLLPLQEVAPDWRDPGENRAIQDWIARLPLKDVDPLRRIGSLKMPEN